MKKVKNEKRKHIQIKEILKYNKYKINNLVKLLVFKA